MATANIVVSLPAHKAVIIRTSPTQTSANSNSNSGYIVHRNSTRYSGEDELDLVVHESGKVSLNTHGFASVSSVRGPSVS